MHHLRLLPIATALVGCATGKPDATQRSPSSEAPTTPVAAPAAPAGQPVFAEGYEEAGVDLEGGARLVVGARVGDESPAPRIDAVLLRDGAELERTAVSWFSSNDWYCNHGAFVAAARDGDFVVVHVECTGGEDVLSTETNTAVLLLPDAITTLSDLRLLWSGVTAVMDSNQVTGCAHGDGGQLVVRGGELWIARKPWAEQQDFGEGDAECVPPAEPLETRVFPN